MKSRRRGTAIIAAVVAGIAAGAWGDAGALDPAHLSLDVPPSSPATPPAPATPAGRPLMSLIDSTPVGRPLEAWRVNLFGYVEGSYNYDFSNAPRVKTGQGGVYRQNTDRLFDFEDNVARLNQLDLTIERKVDEVPSAWDLGFGIEGIFGADARLLHANGLDFYGSNGRSAPGHPFNNYVLDLTPENQFDLFQAYVDIALPIGPGARLRLGKFASFFGGTVDPNGNTFFSHTIAFAADHPITFTGAMATWTLGDRLIFDTGLSRGWNQSLYDNNGAIDGFGRAALLINDQTGASFSIVSGPEENNNNSNYRTLIEATLKYQATDQLRFILDASYGWEPHVTGSVVDPHHIVVPIPSSRQNTRWYGINGYAGYTLNSQATLNGRLEFFRDEEGTQTGILGTAFEATAGLTLTPFVENDRGRHLKLRPEVRMDFSPENRYDNYSKHEQITFAIDAIYNF